MRLSEVMFENLAYARRGVKNNEELLQCSYLKSSRTIQFLICLLIKYTHKDCEGLTNVTFQEIYLDLPKQTFTTEKQDAPPQTEGKKIF